MLFLDTVKRMTYKMPFLKTEFRRVINKSDLISVFSEISGTIDMGDSPFLHFEIHGCPDGFVLNNHQLVSWKDIGDELRKLNIKTRNNIVVSLATCYGAQIFRNILPSKPAPFYGFIGPVDTVLERRVLAGFTQFFEYFMYSEDSQKISLEMAVAKLNEENPDSEFTLCVSEVIFNRVITEHEKFMKIPGVLLRRVSDTFKLLWAQPKIRQSFTREKLKSTIERQYIITEPTRLKMKRNFLME